MTVLSGGRSEVMDASSLAGMILAWESLLVARGVSASDDSGCGAAVAVAVAAHI